MLRVSHLMAIHSPPSRAQKTPRVIDDFLDSSSYQFSWYSCRPISRTTWKSVLFRYADTISASESYLQCWKLSLSVTWEPPCWSVHTREPVLKAVPTLRESLQTVGALIWKQPENADPSLDGPCCALRHCRKNFLLPDKTARSSQPLGMRVWAKRNNGKRWLAVMDCHFVMTCPLHPSN